LKNLIALHFKAIFFCLLADQLHVHVVILLILFVKIMDASEDLIVVTIEHFFDDDIDDQQ
jgi:hypothetical protein